MQFCIQEWKTGLHVPRDLNAPKQTRVFQAHLEGLEIYGDEAAIRLEKFQKLWFKFGM